MSMTPRTIAERAGEELDRPRLLAYLREELPSLPGGGLEVAQFPTGASNLTYLLRIGEWNAVLRRPPLGPVPPKAHDMEREGKLLARLHPVFPLAPKPLLICSDTAVLGAPFHIMEYREGVVIDSGFPTGFEPTPENCRAIAEGVVESLVELHEVDYVAAGLDEVGRPVGFLERQVNGWIGRYERARTDDISEAEPLAEWLQTHIPESPPATVIHNDFKLNNILLDRSSLALTGILDWEMATIGDPTFDLAIFLSYWVDPDDPPGLRSMLSSVTTHPSFPRRAELQRMYAERSGRDLADLPWYLTFAYFKLAVILQQIYARWVRGQTKDPRFGSFGDAVRTLIEHAHGRTGMDRSSPATTD